MVEVNVKVLIDGEAYMDLLEFKQINPKNDRVANRDLHIAADIFAGLKILDGEGMYRGVEVNGQSLSEREAELAAKVMLMLITGKTDALPTD